MDVTKLHRITDLFIEGTELVLEGTTGETAVVWVNKLNSFEDEEARRDGSAARAIRTLELNDNNPEIVSAKRQMEKWDHEELVQTVSQQKSEEFYILAMDDVEADEEWRPKLEAVRRMEQLMADEKLPDDDPKREEFAKLNQEYISEVQKNLQHRLEVEAKELEDVDTETLANQFIDSWKSRNALGEFIKEQRITQIYFALRDCDAVRDANNVWHHDKCEHRRLLNDRSKVRTLPEALLEQVTAAIVDLSVDRRTAGNSDAPTSSSESSEPQSQPEASTPSIPVVMPAAAH